MATLDTDLLTSFLMTTYSVTTPDGVIALHVGQRDEQIDRILTDHSADAGAIITAWNPLSERCADEANEAAHRRLADEINRRTLHAMPAVNRGESGDWPDEPGLFVFPIDPANALALAREFGQHAIVFVERGKPATLFFADAGRAAAVLLGIVASGDGVVKERAAVVLGELAASAELPVTESVFVYGTLQRGECREKLWPRTPISIHVATVRGRMHLLPRYPALVEGDDEIEGELWTFRPEDMPVTLKALDAIEGFERRPDDLYQRRLTKCVRDDGRSCIAYVYYYAQPAALAATPVLTADASGRRRWRGAKRQSS